MKNQEDETKRMTIVIAGRSYPVKATTDEARIIPNIEKRLNDQIRKIQLSYKDIDMQDCLSMVLLTNALQSNNADYQVDTEVSEKLENINSQIESVIGS